jgi:ATP-dependent DNA helicase RecQ
MDTTIIEKSIQDYENAVCRVILSCVAGLPFPLGIRKTIAVLRGSKSAFVAKHRLHRLPTYSVLVNFSRGNLRIVIENLVEAGLLEIRFISEYRMPVLRITAEGQDFIAGKCAIAVRFVESFIDRDIPEFEGFEKKLFDRLRKVRWKIAQREDIPAFMVCNEVVLRELTKRKPVDILSLPSIRGIGEKFVRSYGDNFIGAISACLSEGESKNEGE